MTRLVIEDVDGKLTSPLRVAFEDRQPLGWLPKRVALVNREEFATPAFLDHVEMMERALEGPIVQWRLRDTP